MSRPHGPPWTTRTIGSGRGGNAIRNYIQNGDGQASVSHAILAGTPAHGVWAVKGLREQSEFSGLSNFLKGLNRPKDAQGNEVPTGEVGEITIKSDCVMKGYWNRDEATQEAIKDGWFYTGDAGYADDEGFIYIHDRVKDMIVSGGENVYPAEVENALFKHPQIADVAVVGVPDDRWGEAVKAIVVAEKDTNPDPQEIIAWAKTQIAGYKVPKSVDFIDALPRNPSGKILRRELRAPYWEGRDRMVG